MCDPLTIASLALTAGSTAANYAANQSVEAARNDALAAERIRQGTLNQEADALNLTSQDRYQDFAGQQEAKSQQLGDYFSSQSVPEPTVGSGLPSSSSNIVINEENKQRGKSKDFTDKTGAALGELRAFGDVLGGISRSQAQDASQIGQLGNFKAGSSNVVPFELDEASHAGDGMKLFGDILGGLGSVGTMAGLSGGSIFGMGANPVTASAKGFVPTLTGPSLRLGSLYGGGR